MLTVVCVVISEGNTLIHIQIRDWIFPSSSHTSRHSRYEKENYSFFIPFLQKIILNRKLCHGVRKVYRLDSLFIILLYNESDWPLLQKGRVNTGKKIRNNL